MDLIPVIDGKDSSPYFIESDDTSSNLSLEMEVSARLEEARTSTSTWRTNCKAWWRSYRGNALSEDDEREMEKTERAVVRYPLALGTVNAVLGADMAELKEPKFSGIDRNAEDQVVATMATDVVRHIRIRARGHEAESAMFTSQLVTGLGAIRCDMDNSSFPFRPVESNIDSVANRVFWDPFAAETNLRDRRWHIIKHTWSIEDAVANWPDKEQLIRSMASDGSHSSFGGSAPAVSSNYGPSASTGGRDLYGSKGSKTHSVTILEYEYSKREPWVVFTDPDTEEDRQMKRRDFFSDKPLQDSLRNPDRIVPGVTHITNGRDLTLDENGSPIPILDDFGEPVPSPLYNEVDHVEFPKKIYRRAFFVSSPDGKSPKTLEDRYLPFDHYSIIFCTAFLEEHDDGKKSPFGMMAIIDDPQRYAVKILSSILEMLKRSSKGGTYIKANALASPATFLADYATPGRPILLNDDAVVGDDILERNMPPWPAALERFFDIVLDAIPEVSGVTRALKGTLTQERSNVLIQTLNTQSTVMLQPIYRPLQEARRDIAILLADLSFRYLSDDYINKIIGKQEVAGVTHEANSDGSLVKNPETDEPIPILFDGRPITPADLLRDADLLDFNVEVDIGSASPTARRDFWRIFVDTNLLGQLAEIPGFPLTEILPVLFKYMPLPPEEAASLAAKMEAFVSGDPLKRAMEIIEQMDPAARQELYEALGGFVEGGAPGGPPPAFPPQQANVGRQ